MAIILNIGGGGLGEKYVWSTAEQPDAADAKQDLCTLPLGRALMSLLAE